MWVNMLFVDVNSTMMQASISASRLSRFQSKLAAGKMFSVSGFDVSRCAMNFRLSDSPLMFRFNDTTKFEELIEPVSPLPLECFRFRNQTELVGLANTNTQLPDIIGEITLVKSTVCDTPGEKNHVMATIRLDSDTTVTLSFFDAQAVAFHRKLEDMNGDPRVIVATSVNPKMVGGTVLTDPKFSCYYIIVVLTMLVSKQVKRTLHEVPIIKRRTYGTNMILIMPPRSCNLKDRKKRCTKCFYYKEMEKFLELVYRG
ncbi:uncharacterized protein LOC108830889 isoform X3 [Raphanus sativus]|nr:uncharacterized protein LOC108830889 isoform X3 [Raphanus sativus]XP_018459962.1 uncharacterized protein LOC108830889 isoform X3 [Raphanus sativus]